MREIPKSRLLPVLEDARRCSTTADLAYSALRRTDEAFLRTGSVPVDQLLRIYGVRLENLRDDGVEVLGGNSFLAAIEECGFEELMPFSLSGAGFNFVVLADTGVNQIIACIGVPEEVAAPLSKQ